MSERIVRDEMAEGGYAAAGRGTAGDAGASTAGVTAGVSVIVPAFNAADTLADTLRSLVAQSFPHWEAIVVDDGSTDATAAVAGEWAERDPRIQLVRQPQSGEAEARNAGLSLARFDWLLFLDSDDWVEPTHLERLLGALAQDPSLDAVTCGSARVTPDGTAVPESYLPPAGDLFPVLARRAAFPVHACLVRRSLVTRLGGFDSSLVTSPDWDLWQRVARTGARFGSVPDVLAMYRMRPASASMDAARLARDGLSVLKRGHGPDPRVANPHAANASGLPPEGLSLQSYYLICWCAGLRIGRASEAVSLLDELAPDPAPELSAHGVAETLFHAVPVARCAPPEEWRNAWPEVFPHVRAFLDALELRSGARGLAGLARQELERRILDALATRPLTVGSTHALVFEVTQPTHDLPLDAEVERVRCSVRIEGDELGTIELPAVDGELSAEVLRDAVAARFAWKILEAYFARTLYPGLERRSEAAGTALYRGSLRLADRLPTDEAALHAELHERIGWLCLLQEIWGRSEWPNASFYDPNQPVEVEATAVADGGRLTVEIGDPLPDVACPGGGVEIALAVSGVPLIALPFPGPLVRAQQIRAAVLQSCGLELSRAVVREALLGAPLTDPRPIRARLSDAARVRAASGHTRSVGAEETGPRSDDTLVIGQPAAPVGAAAWRRATLPAGVATELLRLAVAQGQPVRAPEAGSAAPRRVSYAPEFLAPASPDPAVRERAGTLPILLYHRVARGGTDARTVEPEAFERQMSALRDRGCTSVHLHEWVGAAEPALPHSGTHVAITFDHGYQDFLGYAWPTLERFGFSVTVFVVTDAVEGVAGAWGVQPGAAMLSWDEIRFLRAKGVRFGSNSASHRVMAGAPPLEVAREAAASRLALEARLEERVHAFAYPYGAEDEVVQHLVGACGYACGVTRRPAVARLSDTPLSLPRIEVTRDDDVRSLVERLGLS